VRRFLQNLSIKTKLTLAVMLTSAVLLTLISAIVLSGEIYTARSTLKHELQLLANTISANSSKHLVLGRHAKVEALLAALIYQNNIHAAYFFNREGTPIAQYLLQHDSRFVLEALQNDFSAGHKFFWDGSETENQIFTTDHFSLFTPVIYQGERIGTLYLLSDLDRLYGHLNGVAFAITLSLLLMIFLSWLLAGWLQKPISVPLLYLAGLMEKISWGKDYSIRAETVSHDEIGILVDGFNRMLEQIELHQLRLTEHQLQLEQTVADRTIELRAVVTELELAREQADDANQAKSLFLSRMTHELRTPLVGVLGMNELLARSSLSAEQRKLVDTVHQSGQQLLQLIGEVLDFSRIEAGKLQLEMTEFDLLEVVREVVALLTVQAQEKNLSLLIDVPVNRTFKVRADETRIRQVLVNLVGNAIKFTLVGSIAVSCRCTRHNRDSGTFLIEVKDTGVGIPAADQQQIFEIFYQAARGGSAAGGAGLGLAIVKQLIDLMNGKLHLLTTPGQGSRFQVVIDLPWVENGQLLQEGDG